MKKNIFFIMMLWSLLISGTVYAEVSVRGKVPITPNSYEIYNYGEFTGITKVMEFYPDILADPELYLNIKDLHLLNLTVTAIDGGYSISDGVTEAEVFFYQKAQIGSYKFDHPLLDVSQENFILLDIIGKCFSSKYSLSQKDDIFHIFLEVGPPPPIRVTIPPIGIEITGFVCDFMNNTAILSFENTLLYDYQNVQIYINYYDMHGRLTDAFIKNKYSVEAMEKGSVFIPISDEFDTSGTVKVMILCDGLIPLSRQIPLKKVSFDRTITVPEEKEIIFSDVDTDHDYYNAIYLMSRQEPGMLMFQGYEDGTYHPDQKMTRGEVALAVAGLLGIDPNKLKVDYSFIDVPASHWCKNAAGFLVSKGYMFENDGYFEPDTLMPQRELFYTLLKALGVDITPDEKPIQKAIAHNLLKGWLFPGYYITRGEFAQLAYNFMMEYTKTE